MVIVGTKKNHILRINPIDYHYDIWNTVEIRNLDLIIARYM